MVEYQGGLGDGKIKGWLILKGGLRNGKPWVNYGEGWENGDRVGGGKRVRARANKWR